MFDKGGMPMYPVIAFTVVTLFTWGMAIVASYLDDKPVGPDRSYAEVKKKAA